MTIIPVDELWDEMSAGLWDYLAGQKYPKAEIATFLEHVAHTMKTELTVMNLRVKA